MEKKQNNILKPVSTNRVNANLMQAKAATNTMIQPPKKAGPPVPGENPVIVPSNVKEGTTIPAISGENPLIVPSNVKEGTTASSISGENPVLTPSDVKEGTTIPPGTPISLAAPVLIKQVLTPTVEPSLPNEPIVVELGSKKYPVEKTEIDNYIKQKEEERIKKYTDEYLESKKEYFFMESLKTGSRSGNTICLGFTIIFMIHLRKFLEENKDNLCRDPKRFYNNVLSKTIEKLEEFVTPGGIARTILDFVIRESKVISLILSLISIPLFPVCLTGITGPVIDVITVAIGLITENICTSRRIEITRTIKEILKRIRTTKLADFYPGKTLQTIKSKIDQLRNKTRRAFSKEGLQEFKNKSRNRYQRLKTGVSGLRNRFTGLFRKKQKPIANVITGGRKTRKNYRRE
jgi:hypothetical protein